MSFGSKIQQNKGAAITVSVLFLVAVVWVDSATGPEVSLSIFYIIPGVVTAWVAGRSVGIGFAIVSSILWLGVELQFGKSYQHDFTPYGNGFVKMIIALFAAFLTAVVRERELALLREMAGRKKAEMELNLERALSEGIEAEQQRLGKDIHDGLGQHLVSTGFVASMLKTKLEEKGMPEAKDAEELTALVSDAIGQSRQLARGLFPVKLEAEGLVSALEELAQTVTARSKVMCQFQSNNSAGLVDSALNLNLYRIAQEAINNALKHGSPRSITVRLTQDRASLEISIQNDGKQYSPTSDGKNGIGLRIMEHRARLIGGKLRVEAGISGGTKVQCTVPLDDSPNSPE